jgi:hypothetical protein
VMTEIWDKLSGTRRTASSHFKTSMTEPAGIMPQTPKTRPTLKRDLRLFFRRRNALDRAMRFPTLASYDNVNAA